MENTFDNEALKKLCSPSVVVPENVSMTIDFQRYEDDFLYHESTMTLKGIPSKFYDTSMKISPFPKCCGIRVIHSAVCYKNLTQEQKEFVRECLRLYIAADNTFSRPGRYMYAVPGRGGLAKDSWKIKDHTFQKLLECLDVFAVPDMTQFSYNPIMNSYVKTETIITYNNPLFKFPTDQFELKAY